MKIIVVSNSASPSQNASSLQIARMCDQFSQLKNDVTLILPNTGLKKNFFNFYNLKNRFKIIRLNYFKKFPTGLDFYFFAILSVFKIFKIKPDLVITRNFFVSLILSIIKQNHVLEVHDTMDIEGRLIRFLQKKINFLNFVSLLKIICTTDSLKNFYMKKYNVDKKKLKVLHNASPITFKENFKINKKTKLNIGFFGSIYKSRGIDLFLKLSKKDKNNNYFLYGGSIEDNKKLRYNFKNKNLKINSYVSQKKFIMALKKIDICLLPYTKKISVAGNVGDISKYTSPLKIFDFMKMGKIIISSELPVLKEVLNKKNSILIKDFMKPSRWLEEITKIKKNKKKQLLIRKNAYYFSNKEDAKWRALNIIKF